MPRRLLLTIALLALAAGLSAGCADDLAPAARIGDETITDDELMDEVALWAESPALVAQFAAGPPQSEAGYDMGLVTGVLTNRIFFDIYERELQRRELEVDPAIEEQLAAGLFPEDPGVSAQVQSELDPDFYDQLVHDLAVRFTVESALGGDIFAFNEEALADVEVSSRYGEWDEQAQRISQPLGPATPSTEAAAGS